MKTFKITVMALTIFLLGTGLYSQSNSSKSNVFIRVYNLEGKKISKGHITFTNDSILELRKNGKIEQVNVKEIGKIKTKRSGGHNVLVGALSVLQ